MFALAKLNACVVA